MPLRQMFRFGFVLCIISSLSALEPGDIAFVEYNSDNPDRFKFVCLVDIASGTQIKFTDNGWYSAGGWRDSEGIETWTASTNLSAGDVITVDPSSMALSAIGDQIIAYQGEDSSPTMIAAINNEGDFTWQDDATSSNTSAEPDGLTVGSTDVALDEIDNAKYNGTTSGTQSALLAEINDYTNWTGSNSSRQTFTGTFSVQPVAITLLSFNARIQNDNVVLSWHTGAEINQAGFDLYRSKNQQGPWERVNDRIITAKNNAATGGTYRFVDRKNRSAKYYRLASIETSGHIEYYGPIKVSLSSAVLGKTKAGNCVLHPCYPNPFNPQTTFTYELTQPGHIKLIIFDILGRSVKTFVDAYQVPGIYSLTWKGTDAQGKKVPAGMYLLVMQTRHEVFKQKVVLLE